MTNTSDLSRSAHSTSALVRDVAASLVLSHSDATVYVAALQSGASSVQAIAAAAKHERTGTYDVLKRLAHRGLLRLERVGKRTKIVLEPPVSIRSALAAQLTAVDAVLPRLNIFYEKAVDNFLVERGVGDQAFELVRAAVTASRGPLRLVLGSVALADEVEQLLLTPLSPLLHVRRTTVLASTVLAAATATWLTTLTALLPCRRLPASMQPPTLRLVSGESVLTLTAEAGEPAVVVVTSASNAAHETAVFLALWKHATVIR